MQTAPTPDQIATAEAWQQQTKATLKSDPHLKAMAEEIRWIPFQIVVDMLFDFDRDDFIRALRKEWVRRHGPTFAATVPIWMLREAFFDLLKANKTGSLRQ